MEIITNKKISKKEIIQIAKLLDLRYQTLLELHKEQTEQLNKNSEFIDKIKQKIFINNKPMIKDSIKNPPRTHGKNI